MSDLVIEPTRIVHDVSKYKVHLWFQNNGIYFPQGVCGEKYPEVVTKSHQKVNCKRCLKIIGRKP